MKGYTGVHSFRNGLVQKKKEREGGKEREPGVRPLVCIVLMSSGTQRLNTQLWLEVIVVLPKQEYRKKKKKKKI